MKSLPLPSLRSFCSVLAAAALWPLGHAHAAPADQDDDEELVVESSVGAGRAATSQPVSPEQQQAAAAKQSEQKAKTLSLQELHNHWYLFIGAGYRGTVVPGFLLGAFVRNAPSVYLNSARISADFRKNGLSLVPSLSFTEYGSGGPVLLGQRSGDPDVHGNWSLVESKLKSINAELDILWSTPIHRQFDFEYGLGVGVGFTFGNLGNNWVYGDPNGAYGDGDGRKFSACGSAVNPAGSNGCTRPDHSNSDIERVGGYTEKSWFNGGPKPSVLPWLTPTVGVRFKPHPNFQARLGAGWSLYGPWFGLSGFYGVGKPIAKSDPRQNSDEEVIETSY